MSRRNHCGSLGYQVQKALYSKTAFGESRHVAKSDNTAFGKIFSYQTYHTYLKACNRFVNFCKQNYNCKDLESCKEHVGDFIQSRQHLSAYTLKTELSAIGKMYQESFFSSVPTPKRCMADITRSRYDSTNSLSYNKEHPVIDFICKTGLRYSECKNLRGGDIVERNGVWGIVVTNGKGGKERFATILGQDQKIIDLVKNTPFNTNVFTNLPSRIPYHYFRKCYARELYEQSKGNLSELSRKELYYCRNDKKGQVYSRKGLEIVAQNLGHSRISVCRHYL